MIRERDIFAGDFYGNVLVEGSDGNIKRLAKVVSGEVDVLNETVLTE